jgi:hypothetical protein
MADKKDDTKPTIPPTKGPDKGPVGGPGGGDGGGPGDVGDSGPHTDVVLKKPLIVNVIHISQNASGVHIKLLHNPELESLEEE